MIFNFFFHFDEDLERRQEKINLARQTFSVIINIPNAANVNTKQRTELKSKQFVVANVIVCWYDYLFS